MARYTPKVLQWLYRFLVLRDSELCLLCQRGPGKNRRFEIDHIDSNPRNDDPANLCLLCSQCNKKLQILTPSEHKKLVRRRYAQLVCEWECVRGNPSTLIKKSQVGYSEGNKEMQANNLFEVEYREWLLRQVKLGGYYPKDEAINAGAEEVGCSPATATRYLNKLTSAAGVLEILYTKQKQAIVKLRPDKQMPYSKKDSQDSVDDLIRQALTYDIRHPKHTTIEKEGPQDVEPME